MTHTNLNINNPGGMRAAARILFDDVYQISLDGRSFGHDHDYCNPPAHARFGLMKLVSRICMRAL